MTFGGLSRTRERLPWIIFQGSIIRFYGTRMSSDNIFSRLNLPANPVVLAPLAGVSDHPFRRVCQRFGAHLTYVEMISATAMLYQSKRTFDMLVRHESEPLLGVQITGGSAEEVAKAVEILDRMPFDTIDINMGCPVNKVVKCGAGSAILKDPERVFQTVSLCRKATSKPLSAKIRLGWDHTHLSWPEVLQAIESGGADWITVHGRTRSDDYQSPVNLDQLALLKSQATIPVLGNGNIFSVQDSHHMTTSTQVDGIMVSRGALGNPWVFRDLIANESPVTMDEWVDLILCHLSWQQEAYGDQGTGAVCMRKHLLWYAKGWPAAKKLREDITRVHKLSDCKELILEFANECVRAGNTVRANVGPKDLTNRFNWDPKYEMDRQLDRGVGDDLAGVLSSEV